MIDYRNWETDELIEEKKLLQVRIAAFEKRGRNLNLSQKKELSVLRKAKATVAKIIGERHVQLPLL